jgi:hypothetical protein
LKGPGNSSSWDHLKAAGRSRRDYHRSRWSSSATRGGFRCLIAVGDAPDQGVGSIMFGTSLPTQNTSTGNERLGPAMCRTHGPDNTLCTASKSSATTDHGGLCGAALLTHRASYTL